ncbi:bifunctional 3'-5' exonuclease/DNA polymerase [Leucobacter sp. gxy201]|uniref:bifunctional 3'-5' exonuclease/DNA polymerase n=1 Tax=Leucobacter sp. gxy201 TaxID=2957200 RepID=UPI003D9FF7EC
MSEQVGPGARWCAVGWAGDRVALVDLDASGAAIGRTDVEPAELPATVAAREGEDRPRWVWSDTPHWYPRLLDAGVEVQRAHDLRLCHAILRSSDGAAGSAEHRALAEAREWDRPSAALAAAPASQATLGADPATALFEVDELGDLDGRGAPAARADEVPHRIDAALAEFARQRAALARAAGSARLGLLLAAESAGGLIGTELGSAGVPWDADEHDRILVHELGPRPDPGAKPAEMLRAAEAVRAALGDAAVSLDSPPKLLRSLRAAGIEVASTSHWELEEHDHPAIAPLLRYKKLARLLSANGWAWIDEWVQGARYRPVYVPGGVVTGRWASSGGGALQLPRQLRPALRADPGWTLVSADVAQLEPRVLAAMSGDRAMAGAGFGTDLYSGIVSSGIVGSRQEAKIAVLGAMYGGTSGDSGRLVPRLRRSFPQAMGLVDGAAGVGERGGIVSTRLGRSSPAPGPEWAELQARASLPGATTRDEQQARRAARDFGRFTRNFVVQGTAAEWALAWLADLRLRLAAFPPVPGGDPVAEASGPVFARRPHLVFFLHDEVIVHAPLEHADAVAEAVAASAAGAGRLLFGDAPVDFPLDIRIAERAAQH